MIVHPGGRQKFVFTATDPNTGQPLSGYPLELRVDPTSEATATLNPSQIEFDENGKAEIQIINGPRGGRLKIIATLKRPPLHLKALNYILSDVVDPDVEVTMSYGATSPKAHSPIEVGDELRSQFQTGTDFLNVSFDVKKNGISMSGVELVVTATSDKPSVTFRPSTIDITDSISTVMTVSKDVRELSIQVKVGLGGDQRIKTLGRGYGDYIITYNIAGSEIAVGEQYPVGSKHKVMITVTQDGKAVPGAAVTLKATSSLPLERIASKSMPTATFDPAEVITDENGMAETYLTFGDVPGNLRLGFDFQGDRKVRFSIISSSASIAVDATIDGRVGLTKTRTKLIVKTKNETTEESVPYVDIVFGSSKGPVTFQPNKVRTDKNGNATTDMIIEAGKEGFVIDLTVDMVGFTVDVTPAVQIANIELIVKGKSVPGYLLEQYQYRNPDNRKYITTRFAGVVPLNARADLRFTVHPKAALLYTVSSKQGGASVKFNRDYATSDKNGLVKLQMNTGAESGGVLINLTRAYFECGATAPSAQIVSTAKKLDSHGYLSHGLPAFSLTSPRTNTTSLDPSLRWSPISTVAEDIGTTVITVKFLDGTSSQKEKMKKAFSEWEKHANIFFRYESSKASLADILVTFDRKNFEKQKKEEFEKKGVNAETTSVHGSALRGIDTWIRSRELWKWNFEDDLDSVGKFLFGWAGWKTEREKRTEEGQEFLYSHLLRQSPLCG